ncbi:MAG: hypothetical protein EA401_03190 [Planctomycetota bacterium]|nr:MAG: hypothetical protein EA401_03190 [Planctomycetota bacterium]
MEEALTILLSFPTIIWTTLMGVVSGYWVIVIVGALGIDIFPGDGDADGLETEAGGGIFGSLSEALSLGHVPITVVISLLIFKAWVLSIVAQWLLLPIAGSLLFTVVIGSTLLLGSALLSLWLTTFTAKRFRPLFIIHTNHGQRHLIGQSLSVTSSRVDQRFGTGMVRLPDQQCTELQLNIICDIDNDLTHDSRAVITNYDEASNTYTVRPLAHLSNTSDHNDDR